MKAKVEKTIEREVRIKGQLDGWFAEFDTDGNKVLDRRLRCGLVESSSAAAVDNAHSPHLPIISCPFESLPTIGSTGAPA